MATREEVELWGEWLKTSDGSRYEPAWDADCNRERAERGRSWVAGRLAERRANEAVDGAWGPVILAAAAEIDRLKAEVERLTPPPPAPSVFARELAVYHAHKAEWLRAGREGDYVVIKGDDFLGPASCGYEDALRAGYQHFGLGRFMVRKIERVEPVLYMVPH